MNNIYNLLSNMIGVFISTVAGAFFASWFFKRIEDKEIHVIRKLAIRYVDETMLFSFFDYNKNMVVFEGIDVIDLYSKGELNILDCFITEIEDKRFYSKNGNIKKYMCTNLKKEIKDGIWDYYLLLDKNTLSK